MDMSTKALAQVYLSYCEKDTDWVNDFLVPRLNNARIDIIEFEIGHPIVEEIQRAIDEAKFTLLVISQRYLDDSWGRFQSILMTTFSAKSGNWNGLPIIIEKCSLPSVLSGLVSLDLSEQSEQNWQRLIKKILGDKNGAENKKEEETNGSLKDNISRIESYRVRVNNLLAQVTLSRPYLSRLRRYSTEIKHYLTHLNDDMSGNDVEIRTQFDKMSLNNIALQLDGAEITITEGIRSTSATQKNKYLIQIKQSLSSVEESLRYWETELKRRL